MASEDPHNNHHEIYESRYKRDYMDTDNYSEWARKDATARKVHDTLMQVPIQPRSILDFGCGVGGWIGLLSKMFPEAKISGVDISTTAVAKAKERYPTCKFSEFEGSRTPFPNGSFDLIFSFHVLEHVQSIEDSIAEISRLICQGGFACIIFPCGNQNSLQDILMRRMRGGVLSTEEGRTVHFFEIPDGHVRRMSSAETIDLFDQQGVKLVSEYYAGQFFGWIDWLCRGTGPAYIRKMFSLEPKDLGSKPLVYFMKNGLFSINWLIKKKDLDLSRKRNPIKQSLVFLAKHVALGTDKLIKGASTLEWMFFRRKRNGTAQYLVFKKL